MLQRIIDATKTVAIQKIIDEGRDFAIFAHRNPDGDAIGSSLALASYLRNKGKSVSVVMPNDYPQFLKWLPGACDIMVYESDKERCEKVVKGCNAFFCLDFNSLSRIAELGEIADKLACPSVLIDHHPQPADEFTVMISHPEACSTCELVFKLITELSGVDVVTHDIAECIYTGMMTDTGNFAYASNRKDIYLILAELLGKGIDKDKIYRNVFYNYSVSRMRMFGYVMNRKLRVFPKSNAALLTLTNEELKRFNAIKGDTEGLVNMPLQIKGVRFSCFLREEQSGKINVSLRSVDDFPCNKVASEFFNGGGHKNASGGEVKDTMDAAVKLFNKVLQKYKEELTK